MPRAQDARADLFAVSCTRAKDFWDKTHTVRNDPKHPEHERLWQFLCRALLSTARIATPQDLALYLASYAREARARIEIAPMSTLEPVKKALSVRFEGEKGVHFFPSACCSMRVDSRLLTRLVTVC